MLIPVPGRRTSARRPRAPAKERPASERFPGRAPPGRDRPPRLRGGVLPPVAQFAITGVLAVALVGAIAVRLLGQTGTSEAIKNAQQVTRLAGDGIVAAELTPAVLARRPPALARLDRLVRERVLHPPVVRIKVWNAQGQIVYSDERRLLGARFTLRADELRALRSGGTQAEVSDLSRPENRFERGWNKKLLEVYHGVRAPGGQRLLFETYLGFSSVAASGQRLWLRFAPALIGALVLLELAQIPLALSLARRVRRGQREREALLRHAIDASELERKRIARDLHDGVVQNLIGVSYRLAAAGEGLGDERSPGRPNGVRDAVDQAARETRRSIRELRTLLVDIYPPDLHRAGLEAALTDLMAPFAVARMQTHLRVEAREAMPTHAEALLFRVAQESLRNVLTHSGANCVRLALTCTGGVAVMSIEDDGSGFEVDDVLGDEDDGHFGLRILRDLARDANGSLSVDSAPGRGTRVRAEVPLQ